jgi:hypothetical protein
VKVSCWSLGDRNTANKTVPLTTASNWRKCTKMHVRTYVISKIFPGVISPNPRQIKGKGKG